MNSTTVQQLSDNDESDLNTPEPISADIIDAVQESSNEIAYQTDNHYCK